MGLAAGIAYIALTVMIGYSALEHRAEGWRTGVFLSILLLTLPAWIFGLIWLFAGLP